jgi:hypothetical protein
MRPFKEGRRGKDERGERGGRERVGAKGAPAVKERFMFKISTLFIFSTL